MNTMFLSSRERILRTVAGLPVDRLAVFAPLTWTPLSPDPQPNDWKAAENYQRMVALARQHCDFFCQLEIAEAQPFRGAMGGYGMSGIPEGIFDRRFFLTPPEYVELVQEKNVQGRKQVSYRVHTPRGVLTTTEAVQPGEDTVWEIEPLIKDVSDAKKLLSIPYRFATPDMSHYFAQRQRLGDNGVSVCFITTPLVMVSRLTGFQRFLEWSLSESALVERLVSVVQERLAERLAYVLAQGAGPIFRFGGSEQATPPMMSPRFFDRFILGYERPLWEMVRQAGQIVWVHCHGRVNTVIDKYVDAGVQILDPVEPPPQGDIQIGEAKRRARRGPMTLIGNIEWSDLERCRPDEIERLVKQAIEQGGKEYFILGCSAEVISDPGDALTENILRYIEAGHKYGSFDG